MRYAFVINATISLSTEVEAESLEEAIALAKERGPQSLCHYCSSRGRDDETWGCGEIDCGDPGECELVDLHTLDKSAAFDRAEELWGDQ